MSGQHLAKLDGLMESLGRLKSLWASQGIECGVPATDAELAQFERTHRVCLPDDVREYFLRVNGMARNQWWQWDENLPGPLLSGPEIGQARTSLGKASLQQ